MSIKKENIRIIGTIVIILGVIMLATVGIMQLMNGKTTDELRVEGSSKIVTLKCTDTTLTHPVLKKIKPISFTNTINANFYDDTLSSIMYQFDGVYGSASAADGARDTGGADYDIILAKDYNEKTDIFSRVFVVNGSNMSLTITGDADKVSSRTAPYFFLDTQEAFPKTINKMKTAYEAKNFSCKIMN